MRQRIGSVFHLCPDGAIGLIERERMLPRNAFGGTGYDRGTKNGPDPRKQPDFLKKTFAEIKLFR
jgi:hypothetical protein